MNDLKNNQIKETLRETRVRRSLLDCKTYELKIDTSHLSKKKLSDLKLLFIESKWLYNHILSSNNIFQFDSKINTVNALDKDRQPITHNLTVIGSQVKQSIHSRMVDSTKALACLRKHGFKIGKLKFKSRINSVPLKQYGNTYKFHEVKSKSNYIKIQNIKGYFKVSGVKQIPKDAEFANATLVERKGSYYLLLTCFVQKQVKTYPHKEIGIDFGIESSITLSNGKKYKIDIPESKRTRKLRRKLSRKHGSKKDEKKSKAYYKNLSILNRSIGKTNNQKKDVKNKIVSEITNTYETVCVQDESIKGWKDGRFGKQVHNSVLGGLMKGFASKAHTFKTVPKYIPTSQLCLHPLPNGNRCMKLNKFGLQDRTYFCECGNIEDRDTHSANDILEIGIGRISIEEIKKVLAERKHSKTPMEGVASAGKSMALASLARKSSPVKLEAHEFIRG
jgi:putative transposase